MRTSGSSPKPSPKDVLNQEGLDTLAPFHLCQNHLTFVIKTHFHDQQASQQLLNDGRFPSVAPDQFIQNEAGCHSKAKIKARGNKSYGQPHPCLLHPCWIIDSRVTKVQHQLPHQCNQGPIDLEVPGIHAMANGPTENLGPYEDQPASLQGGGHHRCHHIPKLVLLTVYHHIGCWDCTLLPYAIHSLQEYPGELVRSLGPNITLDDVLTILDEHYNNVKALDALN